MSEGNWGGEWTKIKLEILDKYLSFFTNALKNQWFKLVYIDGFAGCGEVPVEEDASLEGSATIALRYDAFSEYLFIEKDPVKCDKLRELAKDYPKKAITVLEGDCNTELSKLSKIDFLQKKLRGVIFLDPYGMSVSWETLKSIQRTKALDVLYLFPLGALVRNLRLDGKISDATRKKIDYVLGDSEWYDLFYNKVEGLFGEERERVGIKELQKILIKRLRSVFPAVSDKAKVLRNSEKNSPMFLLCYAMSNPKPAAIKLGMNVADSILGSK